MQIVSAEEKTAMERKREEMYVLQLDAQDRIRKAAALGDLSENAEYHFAKEENRSIQKELNDLENKLRNLSVVSNEHVPENMVFLGHTVRLLDLEDDSEQVIRIVGEAVPPSADSDIMPVTANSPMGEALMKANIGFKLKQRPEITAMALEKLDPSLPEALMKEWVHMLDPEFLVGFITEQLDEGAARAWTALQEPVKF